MNNTEDAKFYIGKKVAFIYSAKVAKNGSKFRCVWGKVTAKTIGSNVRIMLYPSQI